MKKIIGLLGDDAAANKVIASMAKLGAAESLGNMTEVTVAAAMPKIKKGTIQEHDIRHFASKISATIPLTRYIGTQAETQEEAAKFLTGLANKYAERGWAAANVLDTDFYRRKDGVYVASITSDDAWLLADRMEDDFVLVGVGVPNTTDPRVAGVKLYLEVGTGSVDFKVKKLLTELKELWNKKERR